MGSGRTSQTEIAVLGGLSVEPMSGYALRQAIRDVLGHFWSESFGQIYPTLARLERAGHVRRRGTGRPGASTFAITAAGRAHLGELLSQPIQSVPPRNGLLLRLFFGRQLGAGACRALVADAKADAERRLADGPDAAGCDHELRLVEPVGTFRLGAAGADSRRTVPDRGTQWARGGIGPAHTTGVA